MNLARRVSRGPFLAFGTAIYAAAQWILAISFAKASGAGGLGLFALALAVTGPMQAIANMALRHVLIVDANRGAPGFDTYLRLRALSYIGFFAFLGLIALYKPSQSLMSWPILLLAVGFLRFSESIADICAGVFLVNDRLAPIILSYVARALCVVAVYQTLNIFGVGLEVALFGATLAAVGWTVLVDLTWATRLCGLSLFGWLRGSFRDTAMSDLVKRAAPLAGGYFAVLLQPSIPRYSLESSWGAEYVGLFSALMLFLAAGNLVITALNQTALPRLAEYLSNGEWKSFRGLLGILLGWAILAGVAGIGIAIIYADDLMKLFFGEEFSAVAHLLPWAMCVAALSYVSSVLGTVATATGSFRMQFPAYSLVSTFVLIISVLIIPKFDVAGAIAAFCVAITANGMFSVWIFIKWRQEREQLASAS